MDGELNVTKETTVRRCMKKQIPKAQIFTEIDDYVVEMNCTDGLSFASKIGLSVIASLSALLIAVTF